MIGHENILIIHTHEKYNGHKNSVNVNQIFFK